MPKNPKLKAFIWLVVVVACVVVAYLLYPKMATSPTLPEYKNTEYGFSIALPADWKGYTVSMDTWTGYAIADELGERAYTTGTVVSIHNPKWTKEVPYQDIPVMVFTLAEWNDLLQEKFHIGAAPIPPSELGRNAKYVFALPARYNYAFPPGYEEVDKIIQGKPLKAF